MRGLTEDARVAMAEFNAFSDEYKEKLRDPNLRGKKLSRCLADILYCEIGGLNSDLKDLGYKYKNAQGSEYIEITRLYLNANVENFIKKATVEDAPVLYFLMMNLNWSIEAGADEDLILQLLSYHIRHKKRVEDRTFRKGYIKLFRATIKKAVFLLVRKKKELELMANSIREISKENAEEEIAHIERSMLLDALEMSKLLIQIYDHQSEYAHYKDLGWFVRFFLRDYFKSLKAESDKLSFLSEGNSAPMNNKVQIRSNKSRQKRKRKR